MMWAQESENEILRMTLKQSGKTVVVAQATVEESYEAYVAPHMPCHLLKLSRTVLPEDVALKCQDMDLLDCRFAHINDDVLCSSEPHVSGLHLKYKTHKSSVCRIGTLSKSTWRTRKLNNIENSLP